MLMLGLDVWVGDLVLQHCIMYAHALRPMLPDHVSGAWPPACYLGSMLTYIMHA